MRSKSLTVICFLMLAGMAGCILCHKEKTDLCTIKTVKVTFETTDPGGKFGNRNVHVVWVEDSEGVFVKTLDLWGNKRTHNLTNWLKASGSKKGEIDGITGATLKAYGQHQSEWDMTDKQGNTVPDGEYRVNLELTNGNAKEKKFNLATFTVNKNGKASIRKPENTGGYENVTIELLCE